MELPPLSGFLSGMLALDAAGRRTGETLVVSDFTFDSPVELDLRVGPGGDPVLGAGPPTQWIETTVMPVFHHLIVRIALEDD